MVVSAAVISAAHRAPPRSLPALALLAAAALAAGCSSNKGCCGAAPERAWVPAHSETKLASVWVPAETRMKSVEIPCIRKEPVTVSFEEPVYEEVRVADTRRALAPTTECVQVAKIGYCKVADTRPVLRDVYETRCVEAMECGTVIRLGIGMGCNGFHVVADAHRASVAVSRAQRVKVGEQVVEIPAGCHLEEIQVGTQRKEVAVGAHEVTCAGSHLEERQVGTRTRTVTVGEQRRIAVKQTLQVPVETKPGHWGTQEVPVEVPGWWVTITCDRSKSDGREVVTREEYEALKAQVSR